MEYLTPVEETARCFFLLPLHRFGEERMFSVLKSKLHFKKCIWAYYGLIYISLMQFFWLSDDNLIFVLQKLQIFNLKELYTRL